MELDLPKIRELRLKGRHQDAFDLVEKAAKESKSAKHPISDLVVWGHRPFWWSTIASRSLILERRSPRDASFLSACWKDTSFMSLFNPNAERLPERHHDLLGLLAVQFSATVLESKSLHWVIKNGAGESQGLITLANISPFHRQAEVLLGVPERVYGVGVSAMLMLFDYFFNTMQFHKLYSYVFPNNPRSLKGTLHLGFKQEGVLREHVYSSSDDRFYDVIQTGLLKSEAFCERNQRLAEKLLMVK